MRARLFVLMLGCALAGAGCQPRIGDACNLSTDCSIRGDRVCDTSQPAGYCTVFGCLGHQVGKYDTPGACPQSSTCIAIDPGVPGCGYDDRRAPSRSTRTMCLATCSKDSDCRSGYRCALASDAPADPNDPTVRVFARALDDGPIPKVCVPQPTTAVSSSQLDAAVCSPNPPASADAGADASDAGGDASDASTDADSSADATSD